MFNRLTRKTVVLILQIKYRFHCPPIVID